MRIKELRELIKDKSDDEHIIAFIYDRSEANDHICMAFENGDEQPAITDDEWMQVFVNTQGDDAIWQEFSESFSYQMDKIENARKAVTK